MQMNAILLNQLKIEITKEFLINCTVLNSAIYFSCNYFLYLEKYILIATKAQHFLALMILVFSFRKNEEYLLRVFIIEIEIKQRIFRFEIISQRVFYLRFNYLLHTIFK